MAPLLSDSTFDAVENSSAPEKIKAFARHLRQTRQNPSIKEMMKLSGILQKYTDGYNNHESKPAPVFRIAKGLLTSPDYSFRDFIAVIKNGYGKNESLMRELAHIDLSEAISRFPVPYHIFQGETDVVTATDDVIELLHTLNNKNITYTVLAKLGHFPSESALDGIFEKIGEMAGQV